MAFDLKQGLTIREAGRLVADGDQVCAEIEIGTPPRPALIELGTKHQLRVFLFEQEDTPKPLFGLENVFICFRQKLYHPTTISELSDYELMLVRDLIRGFVAGPVQTITLDLAPPDPLKKFKVIDGEGAGSPEPKPRQSLTEVPKKT